MFRKTQGEPLKPDHTFAFCLASFLMTIAMGGIPHAGSRHQPIRLFCPWNSPGKNTGMDCHFLLQCREPAWGIQPVAKVMRKEARQNATAWSGFRGSPWNFLSIHPQKPESACFTVLCFPPTLLSLTGWCPPTTFFWKKLELLDNKSPEHNKSVSIQNPSDGFLACLPDSYSCTCECLRPPDRKGHRKLKTT